MSYSAFLPSLRHSVPLSTRTTLGLGGPALHFAEVDTAEALAEGLRWAEARSLPVVILGGGSNVLVADAGLEALVLRPALRGIRRFDEGETQRLLVGAGEPWEAVVQASLAAELCGLECLTGIPGDAGATPIQNVGAYGQEVSQTLERVHVVDRETGSPLTLEASECAFGYRDSLFKREGRDRWVVTGLELRLRSGLPQAPTYPELARAVGPGPHTVSQIANKVRELRRSKSMLLDPLDENGRSAGSFFTNPTLPLEALPALEARAASVLRPGETMPRWPADGDRIKLSAAWLIERAGFPRGTREGAVGISSRHSLALVAHEGATASALLALARRVRAGVLERFGVELHPEPVLLGFRTPLDQGGAKASLDG